MTARTTFAGRRLRRRPWAGRESSVRPVDVSGMPIFRVSTAVVEKHPSSDANSTQPSMRPVHQENKNLSTLCRRSGVRERSPMTKSNNGNPSDPQDDNWLDSDHNELVERVLNRDTEAARQELARLLGSELTGEIEALREEQRQVGTAEQMAALEASGWMPWARFFLVSAWVIAMLDAFLWAVGAARV